MRAPSFSKIENITWTSLIAGTLCSVLTEEDKTVAASNGNAAFFAPLGRTEPDSLRRPRTRNPPTLTTSHTRVDMPGDGGHTVSRRLLAVQRLRPASAEIAQKPYFLFQGDPGTLINPLAHSQHQGKDVIGRGFAQVYDPVGV